MTTISEFSAYYLRSVWREGDVALENDLPVLIRQAEAQISRDLRDAQIIMEIEDVLPHPIDSIILPPDFRELLSMRFNDGRLVRVVPLDALEGVRRQYENFQGANVIYVAIAGRKLHFSRLHQRDVAFRIVYKAGVQAFSDDPLLENFYDRHPDFFLAALNVQTYKYLRDFDLSNEYNTSYQSLIEDMRRESNYIMYPSGALTTPLDGLVVNGNRHVTSGGGVYNPDDNVFVDTYNEVKGAW